MAIRRGLIALGTLLVWTGSCLATQEGATAPPLKMQLIDGGSFELSQAAGKVVLVNFWATWCAPCVKELPALDAYYRKHRDEGLVLVAISMDEPSDEAKVRKAVGRYAFLAGLYSKAEADGYGRIWRTPLTFVIDRKQILLKEGWSVDPFISEEALEKTITPLLKAK